MNSLTNFSTTNSIQPAPNRKQKFLLTIIAMAVVALGHSQPLFTYGTKQVSKTEFKRAYLKNNDTSAGNKASDVKAYLELYIRFKLKVQAAYDLRLDTLLKQQEEIMNFRRQIEEPYMRDNALMKQLVAEAEQRGKTDIRVAHIFIPYKKEFIVNPFTLTPVTAKDSVDAKNRIYEAYQKLKTGAEFGDVAQSYSLDPAVNNNKGDLGYITVFNLPYTLETKAYALELNSYSEPFQSDAGWHILKKTAERPATARVQARQILIAVDKNGDASEKQKASALADSLYNLLKAGANFEELARTFSYDASAAQGGALPLISIGEYEETFERAVFGLQKNDDYTRPFETSMGYHIVQRVDRVVYSSDNPNPNLTWSHAVESDKRGLLPIIAFAKQCVTRTGMKKKPVDEKELFRYTDSFIVNGRKTTSTTIKDNTVLIEFPTEKVTVAKWMEYLNLKTAERSTTAYKRHYAQFFTDMSVDYYRRHLEKYDPEFRAQYNEFMEGNMLFEVMERKIWNKSATDTAGLKKHYLANKAKYNWNKSADAIVMNAPDRDIAEQARKNLVSDPKGWRGLVEKTEGKLMADSGRIEWSQIPVASDKFANGYTTPLVDNKEDKSVSFYHLVKLYPSPSAKSYDDAKGQLINDYQVALEEKWVTDLKKKYPVKINPVVLDQVVKELTQ